jgi:hypothetical protein
VYIKNMDWVGKYLIGATGLYLATAPRRAKQRNEAAQAEAQFLHSFKSFPAQDCGEFLSAQRWTAYQIPCYFVRKSGIIQHFVYEPANADKLPQWALEALGMFIELYGFNELKPALELSRDGARDNAICFLWNEKTDSSHIDQAHRAVNLMEKLCA